MVLVKTLSIIIHVTITIHVLLKMNLVKKALNCLSIYGTERERFYFFINWNISMQSQQYVFGSRKCDFSICECCSSRPKCLLNKLDELVSKCRQKIILQLKIL